MIPRKITISLLFLFCGSILRAQPGVLKMTPIEDLNLVEVDVEVPQEFQPIVGNSLKVKLPEGFSAKIFYASSSLVKPRFLTWGPDSVIYLADKGDNNSSTGKIIALPDKNEDGVADEAIEAWSGLTKSHDAKFYKGDLYVAEETRVRKISDSDDDGVFDQIDDFISPIVTGGVQGGGGHNTRTIIFDESKQKIFISVGSVCNACREDQRAVIYEYNIDGSGGTVFASGIRNAVGMALHPSTGDLWFTSNGADRQGDNIPPELIDIARKGGFYGYPFAYANQVYFDMDAYSDYQALKPITANDSTKVSKMVEPVASVQAHSAPMAIEFSNQSFPEQMSSGAFVAYRGSWNRSIATGYKVVYLRFQNDTTVASVADFLSGFLTDSTNGTTWARPVGLLADQKGNLYVTSDDKKKFIMKISSPVSTGYQKIKYPEEYFDLKQNYPNPFKTTTSISFDLLEGDQVSLMLYNVHGKLVRTILQGAELEKGIHSFEFDGSNLPSGSYIYKLTTSKSSLARIMNVLR